MFPALLPFPPCYSCHVGRSHSHGCANSSHHQTFVLLHGYSPSCQFAAGIPTPAPSALQRADAGEQRLRGAASTQHPQIRQFSRGVTVPGFSGSYKSVHPLVGEKRPREHASPHWERCRENHSRFGCAQLNFRSLVWSLQGFDWNLIPFYIFLCMFCFFVCFPPALYCKCSDLSRQTKAHPSYSVWHRLSPGSSFLYITW